MARGSKSKGRGNRVQNVRVMDDYAGNDGAKFDRVLSNLQNSHSQITVCMNEEYGVDGSSAAQTGKISQSQFRVFDDFVSLAAQWQTYRVKRIRYDIYDVAPGVGQSLFWSTFHDVNTTGTQYVPTLAAVVDGPDSQIVPPGVGKISLIWTAKGTAENEFQSTTSSLPVVLDFGGLRYAGISGTAAAPGKYQVFVKVICDFRGRT
jgi:hypothetical protein